MNHIIYNFISRKPDLSFFINIYFCFSSKIKQFLLMNIILCPINPFIVMSKMHNRGLLEEANVLNTTIISFFTDSLNSGLSFSQIRQAALFTYNWDLTPSTLQIIANSLIRDTLQKDGINLTSLLINKLNILNDVTTNYIFKIPTELLRYVDVATATHDLITESRLPCNPVTPDLPLPSNESAGGYIWSFVCDHWVGVAFGTVVIVAGGYIVYKYYYSKPGPLDIIADQTTSPKIEMDPNVLASPSEVIFLDYNVLVVTIIVILMLIVIFLYLKKTRKMSLIVLILNKKVLISISYIKKILINKRPSIKKELNTLLTTEYLRKSLFHTSKTKYITFK